METIAKTYAYHKPSEKGLETIQKLRAEFSALDSLLRETCPISRELSVALTNLETTAMWAIKSVVCNDPGSEVDQPQADPVSKDA